MAPPDYGYGYGYPGGYPYHGTYPYFIGTSPFIFFHGGFHHEHFHHDRFHHGGCTIRAKQKLLARVRRLRGQVEAIERELDSEAECEQVMHLIAGARGAMAGLMAEVVEDHVRTHLVDADKRPDALNSEAPEQLLEVVRTKSLSTVPHRHSHIFLGEGHEKSERKTWAVIWLCGAMMIAKIVGGWLFGSIALVADGMHMSTHAGALLLAALAYRYSRRYANDPRFTCGTGKLGDLAGFTSAIILAMIALLIGYEAISRLFAPVPVHFAAAIPIACLGLAVNIASAWLLSGGDHHHGHSHGHGQRSRGT
jgi:DNA-binding FrmR family transcriptional regulator